MVGHGRSWCREVSTFRAGKRAGARAGSCSLAIMSLGSRRSGTIRRAGPAQPLRRRLETTTRKRYSMVGHRSPGSALLRALILVAVLAVALLLVATFWPGRPPRIEIRPALPGIGRSTPIQVTLDDTGRVERVTVDVVQGMDVKPVAEKSFAHPSAMGLLAAAGARSARSRRSAATRCPACAAAGRRSGSPPSGRLAAAAAGPGDGHARAARAPGAAVARRAVGVPLRGAGRLRGRRLSGRRRVGARRRAVGQTGGFPATRCRAAPTRGHASRSSPSPTTPATPRRCGWWRSTRWATRRRPHSSTSSSPSRSSTTPSS